jgi:hypothetical protein
MIFRISIGDKNMDEWDSEEEDEWEEEWEEEEEY